MLFVKCVTWNQVKSREEPYQDQGMPHWLSHICRRPSVATACLKDLRTRLRLPVTPPRQQVRKQPFPPTSSRVPLQESFESTDSKSRPCQQQPSPIQQCGAAFSEDYKKMIEFSFKNCKKRKKTLFVHPIWRTHRRWHQTTCEVTNDTQQPSPFGCCALGHLPNTNSLVRITD